VVALHPLGEGAGPDFVRWTAKHGLEIGGSTREAISRLSDIRDWVYACNCLNVPVDVPEGDRRPYDSGRGEQFVVRRFSPDMSLATASGLSSDWHEAVAANMSGPNAEFPEPWCPGAESCGFNIAPITTNSELYREGALLHHCVGTHADRVQFGDAYIYSVRRSCERVATLELVRSGSGVVIGELSGPCNSQVPKEVERAVKSWLRAQREFRFPLSEPDRRNSSTLANVLANDDDIPF
jgi:PcfJ-like protein